MDCEWCGKSTLYFNHDTCWTDLEHDPTTGEVVPDPWAMMLTGGRADVEES